MKKKCIWLFEIVFIFSLVFTGCKTTGKFVVHEEHLQMMGNPTTGYSWFYSLSDDSIVDITENIIYMGEDGIAGAPSLFMYKINSSKPGKAELIFEYKRGWEKKTPEDVKSFYITVLDNGKIKIKPKKE